MTLYKSAPNQEIGFQDFRKVWKAILRQERNAGNSVYTESLSFNQSKNILEAFYEHKAHFKGFIVLKTVRTSSSNAIQILLVCVGISTRSRDDSELFYFWQIELKLKSYVYIFEQSVQVWIFLCVIHVHLNLNPFIYRLSTWLYK